MSDNISTLLSQLDELTDKIESEFKRKKRAIQKQKAELEEVEMFGHFDQDLVKSFFEKPYVVLPRRDEEWYLIVPKFFDLNVGYLTKSTDSYNVFIVNKYADYLGAVPSDFQQVFKFKPKIPLKIFDGMLLTGEEHQDTAWERYGKFLVRREGKDKIKVKSGKQFEFVAALISDGILPFIPKPVEKSHLIKPVWKTKIDEIERRRKMSFFNDAFSRFLQTGAVGIYWAMGVGKTIFGLEALSKIKVDGRPNLVVSGSSAALREQWKKQLELIEPAANVVVETYQSWHKVRDKKWGLVIFDECLPYDTTIATEIGLVQIGDIVERKWFNPRIWTFNLKTRLLELKPLLSRFKKETTELVEIETETGRTIRLTLTHNIYLENGNHLPASEIKEGMSLVRMQYLWKEVSNPFLTEWSQDAPQTPRTQQDYFSEIPLEPTIPREMGPIQTTIIPRTTARNESQLERWNTSTDLEQDSFPRLWTSKGLYGLSRQIQSETNRHSPQERRPVGQLTRESNDFVPELSRESTPRARSYDTEVDNVRRVGRIKVWPTTVYDIEVADNHNFFANGILVSNCHHLPAETFSRLSTIDTEYRIGLSATPYREDRRTDYIFALTGFPVGLDWRVLIDLGLIREPEITLYLCDSYRQKRLKLAELLQDPQKTLIYCFSLDIGKSLSKEFGIPFVHGSTPVKDRLEIIKSSQTTIISSAGKEGLSIQDIERTISYNFLFGSRQEETQFFGRLLHGTSDEGTHSIMMTDEEYDKYGKRIYGIQEKGFKIRVSRVGGGGAYRAPKSRPAKRSRPSRPAPKPVNPRPQAPVVDTSQFPFLDERDPFNERMVLTLLRSEFAKSRGGLTLGEIRQVLEFRHVKVKSDRYVRTVVENLYDKRDLAATREGSRRRYFAKEVLG